MRSITVAAGLVLAAALGMPAVAAASPAAAAAGSPPAAAAVASPARPNASTNPEHPLSAVSCLSANYCVAVGYNETADGGDGGPLKERWNGHSWSAKTLKVPAGTTGGALFGVSCASPKRCFAIGEYFMKNDNTGALFESWNGKSWSAGRVPGPAGTTSAVLSGISCPSSTSCVATGEYTRSNGASAGLAEAWSGHGWSDASVRLPAGSVTGDLDAVSCASAKSCVAVGEYVKSNDRTATLAESWNGRSWTGAKPSAPAGTTSAALQGASCPSAGHCVAVGWYAKASGGSLGLAESWNGHTWSEVGVPKSGGFGGLYAVSCASARYCLAVGDGGPAGHSQGTPASDVWNGSRWSAKKVPTPSKGGGSSALSMLQGDKCLSATKCIAVGQLDLGNNEQDQYGFAGFWNGNGWKLATTA